MTCGLDPLLTPIMPMQFSALNLAALAAGMMDALICAGSSLSDAFAGFLSDRYGWEAVFVSWTASTPGPAIPCHERTENP